MWWGGRRRAVWEGGEREFVRGDDVILFLI